MLATIAGAGIVLSLHILLVLGLLNASNVLHVRPFNYRTFVFAGGAAFGIFIAAIIVAAEVRSIWLVLGLAAFWVVGVSYLFFYLRFLSKSFERKRR